MMDTKLMSEVAKQWKSAEPLREELMIYMTQGCSLSYPEALYYYRRLRTENSIFVEFVSAVRDMAYPVIGMLTIEGFTAQGLAEAHGLNMLQAYDALLSIKEDPANAEKYQGAGTADGGSAAEDADGADGADKRGLFGKLFKK